MVSMKRILKVAGAACAATGVVAISGLVASGAAVGAVVEGFKSAANTMRKVLSNEPKAESDTVKSEELITETVNAESQEVLAN